MDLRLANPAIEFRNVTKVYRRRLAGQEISALHDVSFDVFAGEVCAFLLSSEAAFITGQAICPDGGAALGYRR